MHGGFAAAQGLVYSFSRDRHVIPHTEASNHVEDGWRVYGYDAGWNDPRVLLEVGRTPYGQLIVLDEFHESESHVEDAIAWLEGNDKPDGPVFAEHEPSDIDRFRRARWGATKAEKSIKAGVSEVRRRLREERGTGRVGMMVSERCGNLIREFLGYKEENVSSASASDHCLDSLRYLCMGISDHRIDERTETTGVRRRESSGRGVRSF